MRVGKALILPLLNPVSKRNLSNLPQNKAIVAYKEPPKAIVPVHDLAFTEAELNELYLASSGVGAFLLLLLICHNDKQKAIPSTKEQDFLAFLLSSFRV